MIPRSREISAVWAVIFTALTPFICGAVYLVVKAAGFLLSSLDK